MSLLHCRNNFGRFANPTRGEFSLPRLQNREVRHRDGDQNYWRGTSGHFEESHRLRSLPSTTTRCSVGRTEQDQRTASRRARHVGVASACPCCGHTFFPANRLDVLVSSANTRFDVIKTQIQLAPTCPASAHRVSSWTADNIHIDGCFAGARCTSSSPRPVSMAAVLAEDAEVGIVGCFA